jgi:APA family basic amino acid/polyamine antiporter
MNSNIPSLFIPVQRSCADGWFPKSFASVNRFGAPWKILTLIWILGLIPMLLKFNVNMITSNILLFNALKSFLYIYAYYRLPSKFPEAWKKSWLHVPTSLYYVIVTLSLFAQIALFIYSVRALTPTIAIVSIIVTIGCCAFGLIRSKSPDIKITASVWDN